MKGPWDKFRDDLKAEVLENLNVSHRVSGKVRGGLHKDKNYSAKDSFAGFRRLRIPLHELSLKDLKHDAELKSGEEPIIVDSGVRQRVVGRWKEKGMGDPQKLFSNEANLPFFQLSDGRHIPIRKVRIRFKIATIAVGRGLTARHVKTESNHHMEIFRLADRKGREKWDASVVDMFKAYQRKEARSAIINPEGRDGFLLSLSPGEIIKCRSGEHQGRLLVIRGMRADEKRLLLVPINDARKKGEIEKSGDYLTPSVNTLQTWNICKVVVSPLGEVTDARD
jgi:hypothetical protein